MDTVVSEPPPGLYPGAVPREVGGVTFALYAPGKRSVSLIGAFNNWDRHADPLQVTAEGLWWTVKELPAGTYTYQFAVDVDAPEGETVICDPYARVLADDAAYDPPRAIVEVGRPAYVWQHDDWSRPDFADLTVMEIHVGDFTPAGTISGLSERLDYLRDLGVNAIELMPIFEYKGDFGWGYNPAYFFTVEKSYGTNDEMKRLVDEAHSHGIAVILDVVLAHTAHRHPFNKLYPYEQSPWYGPGIGEPNQFGFPTLDYTKGPTQDFSRDVQTYWLTEFHVDGFRYDYCHGIGCRDGLGVAHLVGTARAVRPDVYLIAEYSPEQPDAVSGCGSPGAWHVGVSYAVKALLCEGPCGDFDWDQFDGCLAMLDPWGCGYEHAWQMVNYLESHDEQRVVNDVEGCGFSPEQAHQKAALGLTLLFTMPGQPMLYHGEELGEGTPRRTNERNTLHWNALETALGRELHDHCQMLARLRRDHPALRAEGYTLDASYPWQRAAVYHRWNDAGDEIVVALNFSPAPQTIAVPFPRPDLWRDILGDQLLDVTEATAAVTLQPWNAAIYIKSANQQP